MSECPRGFVTGVKEDVLEALVLLSLQYQVGKLGISSRLASRGCRRISPDLDNLDQLRSSGLTFIPKSTQVRPKPADVLRKATMLAHIDEKWNTIEDFFLATKFGHLSSDDGEVLGDDTPRPPGKQTLPPAITIDPFSPRGANESFILWYAMMPVQWSSSSESQWIRDDLKISADISAYLRGVCKGNSSFEFCWHEHPKMKSRVLECLARGKRAVPFYHVRVSWTRANTGLRDPLRVGVDFNGLVNLAPYYPFIECGLKPSEDECERRNKSAQHIWNGWNDNSDVLYTTIFSFPPRKLDGGLESACPVFVPNPFPYQMDAGQHYVLWYFSREKCVSDHQIELDILSSIKKLGLQSFEFHWYENPKPSHPSFYHVQVFFSHAPSN